MIIRRLHIDNFGCFHDFDLELHEGINHLVWHNEQGKSTLLEFIRRIFWGFPDKRSKLNPYPALNGSGLYGGFLEVTTSDGTLLRLERKGLKSPLKIIHVDGTAESVSDVGSFTGISELFYRNVCAVTLDELTAFAALDDPEIRNRLYGNALSGGGVSLSSVQSALASEAEQIYKKRGTLHLLKRLSAEFAASEKSLAEASEAMPAYERAVLSARSLDEESEKIKDEINKLQIRINAAEKALNAEKLRSKLAEDEAQFAARPLPAPMPEALPPFEEKAPIPPAEFENITLPPMPEPPAAPALEGKCDSARAPYLGESELAEWQSFIEEEEKLPKAINKDQTYILTVCILAGVAAVLIGAFYPKEWLLCIWAFLFAPALVLSLLKSHKTLIRRDKLQKKKNDLYFRYSLNPVLETKELPGVLKELQIFQNRMGEYEKQIKFFEAQKTQLDRAFLEYKTLRKLYDEKCRAFEERRNAHEKKRLENESLCRKAAMELARYESEKCALIKRRNELDELYPDAPQELLSDEELSLLKEKVSALKDQLAEKLEYAGAEKREAALLLKGVDSAALLNIREQLRGRMRSGAERYLVLAAARAILDRAVERSERVKIICACSFRFEWKLDLAYIIAGVSKLLL